MGCFMQPIFRLLRKHRGEGSAHFGSGQKLSGSGVCLWIRSTLASWCSVKILEMAERSLIYIGGITKRKGAAIFVPKHRWKVVLAASLMLCGPRWDAQRKGVHTISNGHYRNHRKQPECRLSGMLIPRMRLRRTFVRQDVLRQLG